MHLFDSFEGLPPAKEIDGVAALTWQHDTQSDNYHSNCSADESFVIEAMRLASHPHYRLYKGWFEDTLSGYPKHSIGILRLDGDWYDSTLACLKALFPLVENGGIIILDDYYTWDGCARAVHDYLSQVKSTSRIYQWNDQVPYIQKRN